MSTMNLPGDLAGAKDLVAQMLATPPGKPIAMRKWEKPIPLPGDALQFSTVEERFQQGQRRREAAAHDAACTRSDCLGRAMDANSPAQDRATNAVRALGSALHSSASQLTKTTSSLVHDSTRYLDQRRVQSKFSDLVGEEGRLLSAHQATVLSGEFRCEAHVYLTPAVLCVEGGGLHQVIPLNTIASVVPCVAVETNDAQPFLALLPLPDDRVVCTAVLVILTSGDMVELVHFKEKVQNRLAYASERGITPVHIFVMELDRAWRAAVNVPLSSVAYGPPVAVPGIPVHAVRVAASETSPPAVVEPAA